MRYGDGSVFRGEWSEDLRHGQGTLTTASSDTYTGQWAEDNFEGDGLFCWLNGNKYEVCRVK